MFASHSGLTRDCELFGGETYRHNIQSRKLSQLNAFETWAICHPFTRCHNPDEHILHKISTVHVLCWFTPLSYLRSLLVLSSNVCLGFFKWSLFFSSPFSHMRATFPESIILSDLSYSRNIWLKYLEIPHYAIKNRQLQQRSWFSS